MPDTKPAAPAANDELARLRAENERLRAELAEAKPQAPAKPTEPSFGISEGQRDELERTGKTVSPFTGARQVADGETVKTGVSADEFDKHTK